MRVKVVRNESSTTTKNFSSFLNLKFDFLLYDIKAPLIKVTKHIKF